MRFLLLYFYSKIYYILDFISYYIIKNIEYPEEKIKRDTSK